VRSKRIGWVMLHVAFRPEIEDFPGNSTTWKECTLKSRSELVDRVRKWTTQIPGDFGKSG